MKNHGGRWYCLSVVKGRRDVSSMEFLKNARDIEETLIHMYIHKPKRYTFFMDKLLNLAFNILNDAKEGNSWYPENQQEVRQRIMLFKQAHANCQALASQIEILHHIFKDDLIPTGEIEILANQLNFEMKLLKGIISKDKKRFADLPK